ncbi:MAG: hypothetical protein HYT89_03650 [Candidatus Omnitrophica bacterium]|nr:hypothetical protein [Candidatus Omnitrophota bacterium]
MRQRCRGLLLVLLSLVAVAGCRQENTELRVEGKSGDAVKAPDVSSQAVGPEVIQEIDPNTKVVAGEPAVTSDEKEAGAEGTTAEDKTGAVAMKMEY